MNKKIKRDRINTLDLFNFAVTCFSEDDSGAVGKAAEITIKLFINPDSEVNFKVTPNGRTYDIYFMENGRRANTECKVSCGELAVVDSNETKTAEELIDEVYPKAKYIAYCPEVVDYIPMEDQFFMFERNDFLNMLKSYSGRGRTVRIKSRKGGEAFRLSIQSFYSETRQKASKPLSEHFWNSCYNQPTVKQFFEAKY